MSFIISREFREVFCVHRDPGGLESWTQSHKVKLSMTSINISVWCLGFKKTGDVQTGWESPSLKQHR